MNSLILNEGYYKNKNLFEKGYKDKIFFKKKKLIDLSHCSGSLLFGHNSQIFVESLKKYLQKKFSIFSHPNSHANEFSKLIKKCFPAFKKIIFCNTGSEAVTKALRISSSLNKKDNIVLVSGSWHGSVGKTLYKPNKKLNAVPLSAGLDKYDQRKVIFIPYNDIVNSRKILNKNKNKINCLIIEPIQASLPIENIYQYLTFLETYCKRNNITLIFDEVITGFRTLEGSVQKKFNIKPDITILGKVLGGGLPIGLIGINNRIYSKLKKIKNKIFFGGTFSGNSMSSYIGFNTLKYLKKNKHKLQDLVRKSKFFQKNLNHFFISKNIDAKVYRFQSILRIIFSNKKIQDRVQRDFLERKKNLKIAKLRKYLFEKGIYYPSNGIIFFSTATDTKSINTLIKLIKLKLLDLKI